MKDIDVQFKWFTKIHSVMGGRAVVNLPEVLDTLNRTGQFSSSAILDTKMKQGGQEHPSSLLSGEQEPYAQSGRQQLSTHSDEQPPSAQNAEVPGPSGL